MVQTLRMGRKPLGRIKLNLTLPLEIKDDAETVSKHQQRPINAIVEELLRPYLAKAIKAMKAKHK